MPGLTNGSTTDGELLEPIAVIGFSLKYPQDADSPASFWKMLEERRCAMTEWPKDRINLEPFTGSSLKRSPPGAHFLKQDLGVFDASFFGMSATEAMAVDPQQRWLLETAYHALENAGIPMEQAYGTRTAVYSGSMADDYKHLIIHDAENMPKYAATGVCMNMVANRLSWFFNFHGPSVNLDSACSSSLMALDLACQGLRSRDSDMALVTGSSLILAVESVVSLMNMNFLSPDGRCFTFDERANGYSRGEGFGVVVIKRLSDAIRDGNIIRAVIRSTGSNQDGYTPGLTQPSKEAQARLIVDTYRKAGLDFSETRFFEAHGTGTPVGDPIEAAAIGSVFRTSRSPEDPLYVGAVKSNIGHSEGGAGVAGLIKTIMVLEKGIIPPNANFERLNPEIDAEFLNLKIPTQVTPWPTKGLRRASVASFGFGGSNAHAILDDAYHYLTSRGLTASHCSVRDPPSLGNGSVPRALQNGFTRAVNGVSEASEGIASNGTNGVNGVNGIHPSDDSGTQKALTNGHANGKTGNKSRHRVFVWSAQDEGGISRLVDVYQDYFNDLSSKRLNQHEYLDQLATTLAFKRSRLSWRAFAIADSLEALKDLGRIISKPIQQSKNLGIGYIFTGQGAQYHRMGISLVHYPVFRQTLEMCDEAFRGLGAPWSLLDRLEDGGESFDINDPQYAQPLTTAVQIALVELLSSFGVHPVTVVGHSSGEIAAAYAVNGLSLQSACQVSYYRGKYANQLKKTSSAGAMLAVNLSETDVEPYIRDVKAQSDDDRTLHIACINSPSNVTVSGSKELIERLKTTLDADGIPSNLLRTGVAYHSLQMLEVASAYKSSLRGLSSGEGKKKALKRPTMISSVTGQEVKDLSILVSADYWVDNMTGVVRFSQALAGAIAQNGSSSGHRKLGSTKKQAVHDLIEIGPHPALQRYVREILDASSARGAVRYNPTLDRRSLSPQTLLNTLGMLHSLGYPIALDEVNQTPNTTKAPCEAGSALVDLPEYPFNHSRRYWFETPSTRNVRLRSHGKLELLGTPAPESTPLEAKWRKFFNVTETPWIEEHRVNGKPIYPAAGMVIMAIEGARQLADPQHAIAGFFLRDATFTHPIAINTDGQTEVHLHMRPTRSGLEKGMPTYEYRIYTRDGEQMRENCRGSLSIQYKNSSSPADWKSGDEIGIQEAEYYRQRWEDAVRSCTRSVPADKMYEACKANGLDYGPSFRPLHNLAWDGQGLAVGEIRSFQWTPEQSQNRPEPHVVHPTTLDAAGQLPWVSLTKGGEAVVVRGAAITRIQSAWLSASGLSYPERKSLRCAVQTRFKGLRGTESSLFALDEAGRMKFWINKLETTSVAGNGAAPAQVERRRLCYLMKWRPELDFLSKNQLLEFCRSRQPTVEEPVAFYDDLEVLLLYYARRTLASIHNLSIADLPTHLQKYVAWLQWQLGRYESGQVSAHRKEELLDQSQNEDLASRIADRIKASTEGKLYVAVGRNLPDILAGAVDPLELLYRDGLAAEHYQVVCDTILSCKHLRPYVDALAHKHPSMKILELGAGTGSITGHVLGALLGDDDDTDPSTARFSQYDYTDISEAFFEKARERFAPWGRKMAFKTLDIERDPEKQGYEVAGYDLIVAAWVLHATRDLNATLRNVRKLLKPGGKLVLLEITKPQILRHGFIFGTLPGWWIGSEDYREWGACITEEKWEQVLTENGFHGIDVTLPDYETESCQEHSIIVATAAETRVDLPDQRRITIIIDAKSPLQADLADVIRGQLKQSGKIDCQVSSIDDLAALNLDEISLVVMLPEIETPLLADLDEAKFQALQDFLCRCPDLLWVTAARKNSITSAQRHSVQGLARVLSTEKPNSSFITLSLEDHKDEPTVWAAHVQNVISSRISDPWELEFQEQDGILHVNRVAEANEFNDSIFDKTVATAKTRPLKQNVPLKMKVANPGFLDSTLFVEDDDYCQFDLPPNEIEIEVKASGINFRDLLVMLGKYRDADTVGCECAGIVTRVGSNCTTLKPGDRVCAVVMDCIRTFARCDYRQAAKLPENLTFGTAAAIPVTGVTAYHSLVKIAHLQKGESILIHSGAGGTGQMAIQIAQSIGAEVFVTVGSDEKKELLKQRYQLPEDHILYSRDLSFAQNLLRLTHGRGVDVVLNSLSGDGLIASWECIAPFGRFVELGKADVESNSKLPMVQFAKNVTFSVVALDYMCMENPAMVNASLQEVMKMVDAGTLQPAWPLQEFPISKIEDAFRLMAGGKGAGKLVINLDPDDLVPTLMNHQPSYRLSSDATYLIAGGLGGLGRSAARWMADMGARHLILLSRSGPKSEAAQELLKQLEAMGVRVKAPRCDVTSQDALSAALAECRDLPPIRGCIQGTMVLQDAIFENMTFVQWQTATRAKIQSTLNLHVLLPSGMDFFIMLSSLAGIVGSISQANYAAGNTFQDAFARYLRSQGQRAVALDLGWMGDVGIIAENAQYARGKEAAADMAQIREREFHALLKHFCDPAAYPDTETLKRNSLVEKQTHQVLIGLVTPAQFREKGVEPPDWLRERALFRTLPSDHIRSDNDHGESSSGSSSTDTDWAAALTRADSPVAARAVVIAGLTQRLSRALGIAAEEIDLHRPVASLGVDSLLAIELRNLFARSFKADMAVFDITGAASLEDLAGLVVARSELRKKESE